MSLWRFPSAWIAVLLLAASGGPEPRRPVDGCPEDLVLRARGFHARSAAALLRWRISLPGAELGGGGHATLGSAGRSTAELRGPLGLPIARIVTDGDGAALTLASEHQHIVASDAADVLRAVLGLDLENLVESVLGGLPFDQMQLQQARSFQGGAWTSWTLPQGRAVVVLDPEGAPTRATFFGPDAMPYGELRWERTEDEGWPSRVQLELFDPGLIVGIRMRGWRALGDHALPRVDVAAPAGFGSARLERAGPDLWRSLARRIRDGA